MKQFIKLFTKDEIFGKVKCNMANVEWQKRGLPHCHLIFWQERKIQPDEIDTVIVSELPNQQNDPILYDIVTKNMVHGPCREHNLTASCMKNGICTKKYHRRFVNDTPTGEDGYPVNRRRDVENGGNKIIFAMPSVTERAVCCHTFILSTIGTIKILGQFQRRSL